MTEAARTATLLTSRNEDVFPVLTAGQMARMAAQGRVRVVAAGDVLAQPGQLSVSFFLMRSGLLEIIRPDGPSREAIVATISPGQFTGEVNMISGRRALFTIRVGEAGEAIELTREQLAAVIQTDAELSEILMRAFLLRRVELLAGGLGDGVSLCWRHAR